jgi:uncharacterized protein
MLIDINANIGHWPFQQTDFNSCKELLACMNNFGTDISVVSNMNGIFYKNTQASNEELHKDLMSDRRFNSRFIPFAIINPLYAAWKHDLNLCINKMGMKGIRLYPVYHDYELTNASCIELVKMARDSGLIVAFTLRMFDPRGPRHWMDTNIQWGIRDVIPIIKEVPDAKYFILNAGNIQLNENESGLFKNTELLVDTSGRVSSLANQIGTYGAEKFAFGTHSPVLDYLTGLLRIESLRDEEADEVTKNLLRSENARKILRI